MHVYFVDGLLYHFYLFETCFVRCLESKEINLFIYYIFLKPFCNFQHLWGSIDPALLGSSNFQLPSLYKTALLPRVTPEDFILLNETLQSTRFLVAFNY